MSKNGKPEIFFSSTLKSPVGSALFAKLTEPDVFQGGDPTWKITLVFNENDPEFIEFKKVVEDFAAKYSKECGKKVDADSVFRPDRNTGQPSITFKSKARQDEVGNYERIPIVDANKTPTDKEPWNGDTCRVAFRFGGWKSAFGVGIKPYLSAVQVLERNRGGGSKFNAVNVFDGGSSEVETPF